MKIGLTLSGTAHVALLAVGMLTLSGPPPFQVQQTESLSADFVPFEAISQSIEGIKEGPIDDAPAPVPTQKPETVQDAENVGETDLDVQAPRDAAKETPPVETAKAPPKAEEPTPEPEITPEPAPAPAEKSEPVPTTEIAALPEPEVPVTSEPANEAVEQTSEGEQFAALPESVPVPVSRPKAPKPKAAKTPDRKKAKEPPAKQAKPSSSDSESLSDDITALLNREDPTAGGAKRSTKDASVGGRRTTKGAKKLSRTEMDALRSAIEGNWSIPVGLESADLLRATVKMNLNPDGTIDGVPRISATGGSSAENRRFSESVRRAVLRSAPYSLPKDKYETWAEVIVNFDASQMF